MPFAIGLGNSTSNSKELALHLPTSLDTCYTVTETTIKPGTNGFIIFLSKFSKVCLVFQLMCTKVASGKSVQFQLYLVRIVLSFLKIRPLSSFLAVSIKLASCPAFQENRIFCTGIWPNTLH